MGYADRVMRDIEEKRSAAAVAVGAYLVSLRDGKKLLDPKASAREKIDIILTPIVKFNEIVKIGRL